MIHEKIVNFNKVPNYKAREILKQETAGNRYKWSLSCTKTQLRISNNYFSEGEYYRIEETEPGILTIELFCEHNNFCDNNIPEILVDPTFAFSDYNEYCEGCLGTIIKRCVQHFEHYV